MKRIDNKKNLYKSLILLIILVIGIGYAYLTSNLSITGSTEVVANTWNIHFENLNVSSGSVIASTPATIDSNETSISYSITLSRPKEYYEFTVDEKNDGTLPGKISISQVSGLDTTSSKVIDYAIIYTNSNPVNIGDILNAGDKKTIKVRVFYKDDITPNDFPANDLNLTLTYTLQYVQSDEDGPLTFIEQIQQLIDDNETCFTKYNGKVTDEVGKTVQAKNVYYNKCVDKRNIQFAGYCWKMIRTTETGGIKIIYNGEPDNNGQCGTSRGEHKGIVGTHALTRTINGEYLYGTRFTYNTATSEFRLVDTTLSTWSDSTYENLMGKFTCMNTTGRCTTLYNVNGYINNTIADTSSYTIGNTNYAQIGTSAFNADDRSPAMVGYMFNKVYDQKRNSISGTNKFGSTFTYANGTYTISGTTQDLTTLSGANIANTHYTCWNEGGTCPNISYVYYVFGTFGYYVEISDGKSITDAINEMLYNSDVNRYNSTIKGIIDSWYAQYLSSITNKLEDTVYCNARNIINYGGWNPNGGSTQQIDFKNERSNNDISCASVTDQFAVGNNKAKLTYPVGLATHEELYTLTDNNSYAAFNSTLVDTGDYWWSISPRHFITGGTANQLLVLPYGDVYESNSVTFAGGVRLVVSLGRNARVYWGTGSETDPWIID